MQMIQNKIIEKNRKNKPPPPNSKVKIKWNEKIRVDRNEKWIEMIMNQKKKNIKKKRERDILFN
jgi:hypothetical protein